MVIFHFRKYIVPYGKIITPQIIVGEDFKLTLMTVPLF